MAIKESVALLPTFQKTAEEDVVMIYMRTGRYS